MITLRSLLGTKILVPISLDEYSEPYAYLVNSMYYIQLRGKQVEYIRYYEGNLRLYGKKHHHKPKFCGMTWDTEVEVYKVIHEPITLEFLTQQEVK